MSTRDIGSNSDYGADYYRVSCGQHPYERSEPWLLAFRRIADALLLSLHPRKVLDAGCAMGMLVEALIDRGIEAWGVDTSGITSKPANEGHLKSGQRA